VVTVAPSTAVAALLGAVAGVGVWLIATGLRPRPRVPGASWRARVAGRFARVRGERWVRPRAVVAVLAGVLAGLATGWVVAAVAVAALVWTAPRLLGRGGEQRGTVERIEAIATWTEMLRDTISAAAGIEQAVLATGKLAPEPIQPDVTALVGRLRNGETLSAALRAFARDVDDPTCDLVVTALVLAAERQARQLGDLLGELATAARAQVALRLRVETGRARTRTSVRVIVGTTTAFAIALVALNRDYLAPYDGVTGQFVLTLVAALFAFGYAWLRRMSHIVGVGRVLTAAADTSEHEGVGTR